MMKKILVITIVALIALPAFCQIKFGIKAGATSSTVPTYDVTTGTASIKALKTAQYGVHAGVFLRMTIAGIYIMPEVVFASTTYDYNVTSGATTEPLSQKFNKLDIPVLVGIHVGPIRINAGPAATILINSPKVLISDPNFKDMYRNATFGYQAGIGFDLFKKLTFDARYGGSLAKKFGNAVTIGGGGSAQTFKLDSREPTFMLSLGYMF
jgi:opacity protein-like surface antigen